VKRETALSNFVETVCSNVCDVGLVALEQLGRIYSVRRLWVAARYGALAGTPYHSKNP